MDTIRKTMAALFAILFIVSALVAQFLFNLERTAFAPQTYQQAFANDRFYERLPSILAESVTGTALPALPVAFKGLTPKDWEGFFRDLLPPETLKLMGDQALGSILAYLNNQSDIAVLSLAPLKERMAGEAGTQAVLNLMRTQPVCTLAELARISMAMISQQELSLCSPPEELVPLVIPLIQGQLQLSSSIVPSEVIVAQPEPGRLDPRQRLQFLRLVMQWFTVVPLLFLLALTVLAVRGLTDWFAWWGVPFLITGVIGVLVSLLAAPLLGIFLLQILARQLPAFLPQVLLANGSQLASAIFDQMVQPLLLQGILLAIIGALMTGAALFWQFLKPRDVNQYPPP
jgi:hypothetical protein